MKNWIIILVAAFLFFSGCQKDEAIIPVEELAIAQTVSDVVAMGEKFVLTHNTSVMVAPEGFTITFADVEEDSRCPTETNCAWEGRAVVKLYVQGADKSYEVILETPNSMDEFGQLANLFERSIRLVDLAPYPDATHPIALEQYQLSMVVNKPKNLPENF